MADIQSAAAEIGEEKRRRRRRRTNHSMKIYMVSLFHRATITRKPSFEVAPTTSAQYSTNKKYLLAY